MESTSSSLLIRLREPSDQAAWRRFADLYTPLLYYWACRTGLAVQDAADFVQDVFVILVRKLPQFRYDPGKGFRSWLRTVAENHWRNAARKAAATPAAAGGDGLADAAVPDGAAAVWEAKYNGRLFRRAIRIMQGDFEEKTWRACWALVVDGKSGAAVAGELGMSINGVYAARSRVLRRLRQELDGLLE